MKVKRFYWVWSTRSLTRHMAPTRSEGLTYCGRMVDMAWRWSLPRPKLRVCKTCVNHR